MKYLVYSIFAGILLFAYSCEKIELAGEKTPDQEEEGATGGEGSNPADKGVLKVEQLVDVADDEEVNVAGYIVGYVSSRTISNTVFGTVGAVETNIVIADSPTETDYKKCAAVQLEAETDEREELNLLDNPQHLGAYVLLTGVKDIFYYAPGLRPLYTYKFVDPQPGGGENPTEPIPTSYPVLSTEAPQVFEGA